VAEVARSVGGCQVASDGRWCSRDAAVFWGVVRATGQPPPAALGRQDVGRWERPTSGQERRAAGVLSRFRRRSGRSLGCAGRGHPPGTPCAARVDDRRIGHRVQKHLGNVPVEASFSGSGLFPSHQLGIIPIDFSEPSIGLLYGRIGQKYDLQRPLIASRPPARAGPSAPLPAEHAGRTCRSASGTNLAQLPGSWGFVRESPLSGPEHAHPSDPRGSSDILFTPCHATPPLRTHTRPKPNAATLTDELHPLHPNIRVTRQRPAFSCPESGAPSARHPCPPARRAAAVK
jgi:hypothetical protein